MGFQPRNNNAMHTITQHAIDVQWAFIGNTQTCHHWQSIQWNEAGIITAIEPIPAHETKRRNHATGLLALPGFINAHTHLELSTQQAIALTPPQTMGDWLLSVVQVANQLTLAQQQAFIQQGMVEAITSGTTTLASTVRTFHLLGELLQTSIPPLRTCWWLEWFHPDGDITTEASVEKRNALLVQLIQFKQQLAQALPPIQPNYLRIGISPHSPYNVSLPAWQAVFQHCNNRAELSGLPWQTHLLESTEEVTYYQKKASSTDFCSIDTVHQTLLGQTFTPVLTNPTDIVNSLQTLDLLSTTLSVVHGLELSAQQADTLAQAGICLVTCPRSNQFLHGKYLPEALLNHPSLTIAVGTDAHVSLPKPTRLDIRLELQALKAQYPIITWQKLLQLVTINGATALGMGNQVGELSCGAFADITCWNLANQPNNSTITPEALLANVLSTTLTPHQVIVNGEIISI
jgi:cytosine/adenosine deaminase-related metal-dependent hydrolase